jgi:hypothetical protein
MAQQLACSIGRYHDANQSFRDGIAELTRYAAVLEDPSSARVSLLTTLADLHLRTGDVDAAAELVEDAAALAATFGAPEWDDVAIDRTRGEIARRRGNLIGAVEIARAALERSLSDRGRSRIYNLLGTTSAALGEFDTAYWACQQELELNEVLGYEGYIASAHGNLAEIALRVGDMAGAARHQRSCLDLAVSLGSTAMLAFSLIVASRVGAWQEDWATAATLYSKAEELLEETGLVVYEDDRREIETVLATLRRELGASGLKEAMSAGKVMDVPQTVHLADQVLERAARTDGSRVGWVEDDKEGS